MAEERLEGVRIHRGFLDAVEARMTAHTGGIRGKAALLIDCEDRRVRRRYPRSRPRLIT